MKGVYRELTFCQLTVVIAINEEPQILDQGLHASGKATRFSSQAFQIVPQVRIDCFHRIGLLLVGTEFVRCSIVQGVVNWKSIRVILPGLGSPFQASLQRFRGSFRDNSPTQHTASCPIHNRQEVDFVFFVPRKVNSSSSSATLGFLGSGAAGKLAVYALTQLTTLCGLTFKIRPMAL